MNCEEVWRRLEGMGLLDRAERGAELGEMLGRETGTRFCGGSTSPMTTGTERELSIPRCGPEGEVASVHHHPSAGGGSGEFSASDLADALVQGSEIACITYGDRIKCADVEEAEERMPGVAESIRRSVSEAGKVEKSAVEKFRSAMRSCVAPFSEIL